MTSHSPAAARGAPLAGVRVLDLTRLLPGPMAAQHLADLGADVIKIEDTGAGDYASPAVRALANRGKRGLRIDLKQREGGWYASGDLGELHADGALFVVGRLKEMIIRSGFNVYPAEVEAVLNAFPAIARSAVVGRPERDGNEEVVAYVELRHGAAPDDASLQLHLKEHLAPYKRPAVIRAVTEFPMTGSGKVLKRKLLELHPVEVP